MTDSVWVVLIADEGEEAIAKPVASAEDGIEWLYRQIKPSEWASSVEGTGHNTELSKVDRDTAVEWWYGEKSVREGRWCFGDFTTITEHDIWRNDQ